MGRGTEDGSEQKNEIDLKPRGSIFNLADASMCVSVCVFGRSAFVIGDLVEAQLTDSCSGSHPSIKQDAAHPFQITF